MNIPLFRTRSLVPVLCLAATGAVIGPATGAVAAPPQLGQTPASHLIEEGYRPIQMKMPISETAAMEHQANKMFAPGGEPLGIFLNRWGGTYTGGNDDAANNVSSIVSGTNNVGAFLGTDEQWDTVKTCVADMFAPFNVFVTDFEPTDSSYVEAVVGGSPGDIGMPYGVGGVAPFDPFGCGIIEQSVVYAFADVYGTSEQGLQMLCETVSQEVAHAFSLDHELLCEDPMTYLDGCGEKSFQNIYAACGEWEERECSCDRESQNSVLLMSELLGVNEGVEIPAPPDDNEHPEVRLVSPSADGTRLVGEQIEIVAEASDDVDIVSIQLDWKFDNVGLPCPAAEESWRCDREGDAYVWTIYETGRGLREFSVKVRDVVGKTAETETVGIWFGDSLDETPPNDTTVPEVQIIAPLPNGSVMAGETFQVVATAYDAHTSVAKVELLYQSPNRVGIIPCPIDVGWFSCTQNGGTYTWNLRSRRESVRTIQVLATDELGNRAESEPLDFFITEDESEIVSYPEDDYEPNDTWELAGSLRCGEGLELSAMPGDVDWFRVNAPAGFRVQLDVLGMSRDALRMSVHESPVAGGTIVGPTKGPTIFTMPRRGAAVKVQPVELQGGDYRLIALCLGPEVPNVEPPALCSHTDTSRTSTAALGVFALLGLAGLLRRRRR
jgi:MYXO-CTERM domain-containing protein